MDDPSTFSIAFPLSIMILTLLSIVYAIKLVVDARTRNKLLTANLSAEVIRTLLEEEAKQRRRNWLRFGVVLIFVGLGFGLVEITGWREVTPGAIALLLMATGIGSVVFYLIERRHVG